MKNAVFLFKPLLSAFNYSWCYWRGPCCGDKWFSLLQSMHPFSISYLGSGRQQTTELHPRHLFHLDICRHKSQIWITDFFKKQAWGCWRTSHKFNFESYPTLTYSKSFPFFFPPPALTKSSKFPNGSNRVAGLVWRPPSLPATLRAKPDGMPNGKSTVLTLCSAASHFRRFKDDERPHAKTTAALALSAAPSGIGGN